MGEGEIEEVTGWSLQIAADNNETLQQYPPLRFRNQVPTFAVRETASLGIMGEPRVSPLNPSEMIVFWEHYRLRGV